jgi:hypothetical protein
MKDQGLVPGHKLTVTKTLEKHSTTLTIRPKTEQKETPQWRSITLAPTDAKEIEYTAVGKNGKSIGETKSVKPTDSKKPVVLEFATLLEADHFVIVVVNRDNKHPSKAEVQHAVACIEQPDPKSGVPPKRPDETTPHPTETTQSAGTTGHPSETTHVTGTTPAAGTTTLSHTKCSKHMDEQGLVPNHKLTVTKKETKKETILFVKPTTPQKSTPEWVAVTLAPTDAKEVKVTPVDKNGNKVGETKVVKSRDSHTPVDVHFTKPQKAEQLEVEFINHDAAHTSHAEVINAIACIEDEETTTHLPGTIHLPETSQVPGTTFAPDTTPGSSATTTRIPPKDGTPKKPCNKDMHGKDVIPRSKLSVTSVVEKHTTTLIVKSEKPQKETPQWVSITVSETHATEIKYTPIGKNGKPVEETQVVKVTDSKKVVVLEFKNPPIAEKIVIVFVHHDAAHPAHAAVLSAVACFEDEETTTLAAGQTTTYAASVTTTTHATGQTTPHHPTEPKRTCSKNMNGNDEVPRSKLTVTEVHDKHTTKLIVYSATSHKDMPEWVSVTIAPTEAKEVKTTPVNKKGFDVVKTKYDKIKDHKKPFEIVFYYPVKADHIVIVLVHPAGVSHVQAEVLSAKACIESEETTTPHAETTPPVPGTTNLPGATTQVPGISTTHEIGIITTTTIAGQHDIPSKVPCSKLIFMLKNGGAVPRNQLSISTTSDKHSTTVIIRSAKPQPTLPEWVEIVLEPADAKEVKYTPKDKTGKDVEPTKTQKIQDSKKSIDIVFVKPVKADHIEIVIIHHGASHHVHIETRKVVACFESKEDTTTPHPSTSVAPGESTPHPAPTTSHPSGSTPSVPAVSTTTVPSSSVTTTVTLPPTTATPVIIKVPPIPFVCTAPLQPVDCLCHKTCDHMAEEKECPRPGSAKCHKGCQCPLGTVMHNATCIKEADCPCVYNNQFYKHGEKIPLPGVHCAHMVCTSKGLMKVTDLHCSKPETCSNGKTFQSCPCHRTCHDDKHVCDQSHCTPGCACPVDTVWNGAKCVEPKQCTCKEGNVTYADGQHWDVGECTKCHCVSGREKCSEICRLTEEMCKKQGKKLFNKDLSDSVCCRCVSEEPHCIHNGEEKPIGAVWHKGLCETYTCTKSETGAGMIQMTKTECPACAANEQKEYVANKCCPICRKKTPPTDTPKPPTTPDTQLPRKCKEVMENAKDFADDRVELFPANKGTPSDLRPITGKGWNVLESDKPVIILQVSTNDDTRPGQLEKLTVIGNVQKVTISYTSEPHTHGKPDVFKPYKNGQELDVEHGEVILIRETDVTKTGLVAYQVKITVVKAVKPELPLNLKLKVYACHEDVPEPCNEWEFDEIVCADVMKKPSELPDSRITLIPSNKGTPSDLRPAGKGWQVSKGDASVVVVNLASPDNKKPGLLEKVVVLGNVKTVNISFKTIRTSLPDVYHGYNKDRPIEVPKNGEIVIINEHTKKAGIMVYDVRIIPIQAVDEQKPFALKLKLHACIQDTVKEEPKPYPRPQYPTPKNPTPQNPTPQNPTTQNPTPQQPKPEEPGCDEILEDFEDQMPDKRITMNPATKGTPADIRPQGKGWAVTPADKPTVTFNIATIDGKKPGLLSKICVDGNVQTVKVETRPIRPNDQRKISPTDKNPDGFTPLNEGKPIDVSKTPVQFKDPVSHKPGVMVYQVRVTLLEPKDPKKPFDATFKVHACLQDDLEYISTQELEKLLEFEKKLNDLHVKH